MPFEIVRNDITNMRVDAIVNTANPRPVIGSGTDSAVHRKAGPALLRSRKEIGDIMPGHAAVTPAFDLPAKYILHTVSPAWVDGNHREEELLRQAYDAALQLAEKKNCESVAFPLMAAGSYGFPRDKALSVAIQAFTDFLMKSDMMIYLVVFNSKAYSLAGGLFADVKSYIDENYVAEQSQREYPRGYGNRRSDRRRQEMDFCEDMVLECAPMPNMAPGLVSGAVNAKLSDMLDDTDETFTEALLRLLAAHGEKDSVVYRQACISRQLFNKIINDKQYSLIIHIHTHRCASTIYFSVILTSKQCILNVQIVSVICSQCNTQSFLIFRIQSLPQMSSNGYSPNNRAPKQQRIKRRELVIDCSFILRIAKRQTLSIRTLQLAEIFFTQANKFSCRNITNGRQYYIIQSIIIRNKFKNAFPFHFYGFPKYFFLAGDRQKPYPRNHQKSVRRGNPDNN